MQFQKVGPGDLALLREIAETVYRNTFAPHCTQEDMDAYAAKAFSEEQLLTELQNPDSLFYFGLEGERAVGYIKLNHGPAQTELQDDAAIEVERLYLLPEHQGKGYGGKLLQLGIDYAKAQGKAYVWLGVWENNLRAQRLYEKHGFYRFSQHPFPMGEDIQTDYLLRKDLI